MMDVADTAALTQELKRVNVLNRVLMATTFTLDVQTVYQTICNELAAIFDVSLASVWLFDEARTSRTVQAEYSSSGTFDLPPPISINQDPVVQYILEHQAPLFIANIQTDERVVPIREMLLQRHLHTLLVAPIWWQGAIVGTIGMGTSEARTYAEEDIALLEQVASAASHALGNARLYAEAQQELERRRAAEVLVQAQAEVLAEVSTPLLALADRVLLMPLIGLLDSFRAQQVLSVLLEGVQRSTARIVIIDISGVSVVDTYVAGVLAQATQAMRLLGARTVLTGIRPEVAQILVNLGVKLGDLETCATLQQGVQLALRRV